MSRDVNPRRRYNSAGRQEQARQNRWRTLQAAREMFLTHGYATTTVPAVAQAARVSPQSVYKAFGNKAGLLKAVFDVAIAGDDEPVPMLQREALSRVRDEADPRRKLELYGQFVADVAPRHVPVQLLARTAAATNPDAAEVWHDLCAERLHGMSLFAHALADAGHLRPGITRDQARDLLWTYNSPETYDLLVNQRGWTARRYGTWIADSLTNALLPTKAP
jgi:AcrR family transcriptional regulator